MEHKGSDILQEDKLEKANASINDILSRIRYMKPFIYKLSNTYCYLGANTCHECNDEEVARYSRYLAELNALDACRYHIECNDSKNLGSAVHDIMDVQDLEEYRTQDSRWRLKIAIKMESLSREELQDVERQLENLDRAFKYIAGSYCVDKLNNTPS